MKASPPTGQTPRTLLQMRRITYKRDLAMLPAIEIEVDGKTIRYSASEGSRTLIGRVSSIFAKEPTTIPYLETFGRTARHTW